MTNIVDPLSFTVEQVKQWAEAEQKAFNTKYMTPKEVEELFKISKSRQTQLADAGKTIVVREGNRAYYSRDYAMWYFSAYADRQQARASTREAKKLAPVSKGGRPKKNKNEFKYTLFGVEYTSNLSIAETEAGWRQHLCQSYPQYFSDVAKQVYIKELMHEHDRAFTDAMMHISTTFSKLRAGAVK